MSRSGLRASNKIDNRPQTSKAKDKVQELLIRKMVKKFAQYPESKELIEARVIRFINQNRLTQANLLKLEKELSSLVGGQKEKSQHKTRSPKSKKMRTPSKKSEAPEALSKSFQPMEYNEDRDWDAILKFNTELHQEEIMRDEQRKKMQQTIIKEELERQRKEKMEMKKKANEEQQVYQKLQDQHLKVMDNKEKERFVKRKEYERKEKEKLDKQFQEELVRKKQKELEEKNYEKLYVQRIQEEIKQEQESLQHKRELEKEYQRKMMEENELNKKRQREEDAIRRQQEKTDMKNYIDFMDKQEADQLKQAKEKELRTQTLMSQMANKTIKEIDKKRMEEEEKAYRYQQENELRDKLDEEERLRRVKEGQDNMREFLKLQMKEKKLKAIEDKKDGYVQAEMWKKDVNMYIDEEKAIKQRTLKANREYADYLKKQMDENKKQKRSAMNKEEYLMNKKLIDEIDERNKRRTEYIS